MEKYKDITKLCFWDTSYKYGYHVRKEPSMLKTVLRIVRDTNLMAIQIYISSPKSKAPPTFDWDDLMLARKLIKYSHLHVNIHGCLLYNLAGTTTGKLDDNFDNSLRTTLIGLTAELDYGVMLGDNIGVVVHPGSQKDTEEGLKQISKSIELVLTTKTIESQKIAKLLNITEANVLKKRIIILENAAGEGTKLCSTLEEISTVIKAVKKELQPQIKVCIDTAHSFGRGIYDWGKEGEIVKFYKDFDRIIGLNHLCMFHFNDSMSGDTKAMDAFFGSRKDRHEQLGDGYIFDINDDERFNQIKVFMLEARKRGIAVIGEPPRDGLLDWSIVIDQLSDTEFPLLEIV